MKAQVSISVIVCTFRRPDQLRDCIDEIASQAEGLHGVEAIIVDNNSGDDTERVSRELCQKYPGLVKYVLETNPGPCFARNRGRTLATRKILAFLDDDAIPHREWLVTIQRYFDEGIGQMLTGRVFAKPIGGLPNWFPENLRWVLAEYEHGESRHDISYPEYGFPACNFAVSTEAYDAIGGFNERLRIYGEEVDFIKSIGEKGFLAHYDPKLAIDHCPDISRMTKKSLLKKAFQMGRGVGALHWLHKPQNATNNYVRAVRFLKQAVVLTVGWCLSPARFDRGFTAMMNYGSSYQSIFGEPDQSN